jgi:hypothetical protein
MSRILCVTVQSSVKDEWLKKKMCQLTVGLQKQLADGLYSTVIIENHNDINSFLSSYDWLFIQSAGDYIVDKYAVRELLHNLSTDVGLIGHILWEKDDLNPKLHKQCLIINTKAIKQPIDFFSNQHVGYKFLRSDEDMHGGYCPAYITITNDNVKRSSEFGTDLMSQILENGYKVINFDLTWRYTNNTTVYGDLPTRGYLNPEKKTDLFSRCLKSMTIDEKLDESHVIAINTFKKGLEFNVLNVWHYDEFPKNYNGNLVICPCNGLLGENIAWHNNIEKIIFYDINKNNIDLKKQLYTDWNQKDYQTYCENFAENRMLVLEPYYPKEQLIASNLMVDNNIILENWSYFKNLNVEFIHGDIFEILDTLLDNVIMNTVFHTSTIFNNYIWTNIKQDEEKINKARELIQNRINETNSIWVET